MSIECGVCYEFNEITGQLPCGHPLCTSCLPMVKSCPFCRGEIPNHVCLLEDGEDDDDFSSTYEPDEVDIILMNGVLVFEELYEKHLEEVSTNTTTRCLCETCGEVCEGDNAATCSFCLIY